MIDLGLSAEIEKEEEIEKGRMKKISKEFGEFFEEKIAEHKILSLEFITILNNHIAVELDARMQQVVNSKAQQNLSTRSKIMKSN